MKRIHCNNYYTGVLSDSRFGCEVSIILQVIEQTRQQINHFCRGLKDTGIWPLLSHRRDVIPVLFPRESDAQITPQVGHKCVKKIYPNNWLLYSLAGWNWFWLLRRVLTDDFIPDATGLHLMAVIYNCHFWEIWIRRWRLRHWWILCHGHKTPVQFFQKVHWEW